MPDHSFTFDISVEYSAWKNALPDHAAIIDKTLEFIAVHFDSLPDSKTMELSITLTNDARIQELNRDYREKDNPTNVLSFPQIDFSNEEYKTEPLLMLGDVVVALETIQREAGEQSKSLEHHFIHMLIHSVLHLFGHDHEEESEAEAMEALEIHILKQMDIENPYQT